MKLPTPRDIFFSGLCILIGLGVYLGIRHDILVNRSKGDEIIRMIDSKTQDRFTGKQGRKLAQRISRLEAASPEIGTNLSVR